MVKSILISAYLVSVICCFVQVNEAIETISLEFRKRHPKLPFKKSPFLSGLPLSLEILFYSAVPILNIYICKAVMSINDYDVMEVIRTVENKHHQRLYDLEHTEKESDYENAEDGANMA